MKVWSVRMMSLIAAMAWMTPGALAQTMKPGLWEYQSTMKSQSGEMEAAMAEMQ